MTREGRELARVLNAAADLIEPEGAWTQGEYARDKNGIPTSPVSKVRPPVCFCLLGAIAHVTNNPRHDNAAVKFLESHGGQFGLHWRWNDRDDRTQAEVVQLLRTAASLQEDEAGRG